MEAGEMGLAQQEAKELIDRLPDNATWDDIMYAMYVRAKIEIGLKDADEGRVISHEEIKKEFLGG
jgi:predicted transcriptional regulator